MRSAGIVIVGAGPAGLMAAIAAGRAGRHGGRVILCEQLPGPGAKLLASGGSRCNLTNLSGQKRLEDFAIRFGRQWRFALPALEAMPPDGLRRFLADLGVATASPDGFHVFPASNRSADVLNALLAECRRRNVDIRCGMQVTGLLASGGRVAGVEMAGGKIAAGRVIVASGGCGYPKLGGTGGGYALARQVGHEVRPPVPALAPLIVREAWARACPGVSLPNGRLWIDLPRRRDRSTAGEVLFTHAGLSGPAALDISGDVAELLARQPAVPLRLDLCPGATAADWLRRFDGWQRDEGQRLVHNLLRAHLPHSLARAVSAAAGGPADTRAAELSRAGRQALAERLTAAPLTAVDTGGFERAMVTRGGVALKQVDPGTLASRLVAGLYLAGEVLDLDGPCGGYNLQWAFSSGWLAGIAD